MPCPRPRPQLLSQSNLESSDDEPNDDDADIDPDEMPATETPSEKVYKAATFQVKFHQLQYNGEPFPGTIGWRIRSGKGTKLSMVFKHDAELL